MITIFSELTEGEVIDQLSPSLKTAVVSLETKGLSYEAIGTQMSANPSFGLAAKGGEKWDGNLFQKILHEIRTIVCTAEEKYKELRESLKKEGKVSADVVVALVTGVVGKTLGVAVAACVPFVILAIAVVLRAGLEVFCKMT